MTDKKLETLKMTADKSAGAFVETLKGKTGTGFAEGTRVHKDWWAKTISFDDAMEAAQKAAREREDIMTDWGTLIAEVRGEEEEAEFVLRVGDRVFAPTDHALQQLSIKAGVKSASILREMRNDPEFDDLDASVMVELTNNAIRKQPMDKEIRLRTYTDGTVRAIVSSRYAPVDNRWYLEVLKEFLPDGRLSHWRGNEDTIYGNIILPNSIMDYSGSDDSDYGGMLSVGNCEIGTRTVSQRPSLFRSICMNGCIWGQVKGKSIKRRHVGDIDLDSLKKEIAENVVLQLPLIETGVHKFLKLREFAVPKTAKMQAVIAVACMEAGISKKEIKEVHQQWAKHEAEHVNLFGVVNAITRAGQLLPNEDWVKFDEIAGGLVELSTDKWGSYTKKASTFTVKDFEKLGLETLAV